MPEAAVEIHLEPAYRAAEQELVPDPHHVQAESALQFQPQLDTHETELDALFAAALQSFNDDATRVQLETVQAHVEAIYLPGDYCLAEEAAAALAATNGATAGLESSNVQVQAASPRARPRSQRQRRQAPVPNGFPCDKPECSAIFDRKCDLK